MGYNKKLVKELITFDQIFELLDEFGGEPEYVNESTIISRTICHNPLNAEASRKLYYYHNEGNGLFHCYSGCPDPSFDVFELIIKIANLQFHQEWDLNQAVTFLVYKLGIDAPTEELNENPILLQEDFEYFDKADRIKELDLKNYNVQLQEYDEKILSRFNYNVQITPWLKEGITKETMKKFNIGYYPGNDVITIPHYDSDARFIGLRGRSLCKAEAEMYGKYRPIRVNGILYNHPLGYNLYGLNATVDNIKKYRKAIVLEGEKSVLMYDSFFGSDNNIAVACCGCNFTVYQYYLLKKLKVDEIVIAFDKQYKEFNDEEHLRLTKNYYKILNRHINDTLITFMFDAGKDLQYKDSPIDRGPEIFMKLFKERRVFKGGMFK